MTFIAIFLIIVTFVVLSAGIFCASTYNSLIKSKNKVKNSLSQIDAQLQRRFDLIPNLVETVKGHAEHEQRITENVENLRKEFMSACTNAEKFASNTQLTAYLNALYNIAENYPKLKANENFLKLQTALAEVEEDITYARQFYNDAVTIYNNKLMVFPNNIIAGMFKFKEELLFDAEKSAEKTPKINFVKKRREDMMCPVCGAPLTANDSNCQYCGCLL